jgi:arginyl-tRNA synthetase
MKFIQEKIRQKFIRLLNGKYDINANDIEFSIPPNRKFGDISTTIPFVLAKKYKQKPFLIGNEIIEMIFDKFDFVDDIKLANGGFINFYLNKTMFLKFIFENMNRKVAKSNKKTIVEHTSINPNKSAHIGHLRNSCLGDTLGRALRFAGDDVEIQNYLDDTGIQVSDVVWGVLYYKKQSLNDIKAIDNLSSYLWELYTEVHKLNDDGNLILEQKKEVHRKIEDKINPEYEMSDYISKNIAVNHIDVMDKLGIRYDLLIKESDIISLDFFSEASKLLKDRGIMYLSEDPKKENCWVIKYKKENIEKIIIRSNGTITYIGKDIAYTLWKTGYFKQDFFYREFYKYDDSKTIYISEDTEGKSQVKTNNFGKADMVYNVIDTRQSYLQNIILQILKDLSEEKDTRNFSHFSYEMVALTQKCAREMNFDISEEQKQKSFIEVSGRKGIAIKADDLIERMKDKAYIEVKKRNSELDENELKLIAEKIAIGALRYFMIRYNSNTVIAFDFDEVLAFEGDTGPYLQYTLVRLNSILNKTDNTDIIIEDLNIDQLEKDEQFDYYNHLLNLSLLDNQVHFAVESDEISLIPNYTYSICQKFNNYYHKYSIISEKNINIKNMRIALLMITKNRLEKLFSIMGIPIPKRM